ncbi:MAG: multiphosphoryl transfer protein [Pseudonocardiales bacterium]|nr:multiphosphoryl transfer protein [Pseudonocardiales bacterium]
MSTVARNEPAGLVGLVVVSHSRALARAAVALAGEMLHGRQVQVEVAAGLDETTFGTDAGQIIEAITAADQGQGVVVLMDLGSALLSAELALELLDDDARARVLLCPAPLVEGLIVAAVAAAGGAGRDEVAAEASAALAGKTSHLAAEKPAAGGVAQPSEEPAQAGELTGVFTVTNLHGLHARPASRLVQSVRMLDARVLVRNRTTGSPWVPAGSLSKVATLGALHGHEVEVRAIGNQAPEALDHLLTLAARGFDEATGSTQAAGDGVAGSGVGTGGNEAATKGTATGRPAYAEVASADAPLPASPGVGIGPAWPMRLAPVDVAETPAEDPATEWRRLNQSIATVRRNIGRVRARAAREVGEADAAIFDAHLLLLDDTDLLGDVHGRLDSGWSAAAAWSAAIDAVAAELATVPDPYLQARAADVAAVGESVLRDLLGLSTGDAAPAGVVVAGDLTPTEAAELDRSRVDAVVLAYGSPTAHSAILLRARGIPAVVGAGAGVLSIADGTLLAVDGSRGEVVADPASDVQARFRARAAELARQQRQALAGATSRAVTRDGVEVLVGANVGSVADARSARASGADLAGLVRTEFLFLGRPQAPDVDEQESVYREVAEALDGRRITFRTLDVGGDKPLSYLPMPTETNPFLGVRGIRLSLARPQLLADQLLALVRVAHDVPISLMFPMIATMRELVVARRMLDDAIKLVGRGDPPDLHVGIMVEVPATALKARAFAPHVDFFSIGTNDLTQYALAAERGNSALAAVGDPFDPGVLALIEAVCRGATASRAVVAVCGELAADERATGLLIGLGVRELSVAPGAVPMIKESVRRQDRRQAGRLAAAALAADGADAVRELLTTWRADVDS